MDAIGIAVGSSRGLQTTAQGDYRNSQMVPIGSTVTQTQPLATLNTVVSLRANVACWFRVGGTAAANTAGSDYLPANVLWQIKIPQGAQLSFIQATGPGWVSVTPLANPQFGVLPASAFDWDFTSGALPAGMTFTRTTAVATSFNSAGVLVTAAANAPRFDYDPITLRARGLLIELTATNSCLWCRDLTNAAWVKTNVTAAKTQTGIDGVASAASSITASAANGTALQAITLASGVRALSVYVKRLVGTGVVNVTLDGVTWTPITVTAGWTRVVNVIQTLANPNIGFQIVTSGDSIAVDYVQLEATYSTSVILTTTAGVARGGDVATLTPLSWYNASAGTLLGLIDVGTVPVGSNRPVVSLDDGTTNNRFLLRALNTIDAVVANAGAVTWAGSGAPFPASNVYKDAVAYQSGASMAQAATGIVNYGSGPNPTQIPAGINRISLGGAAWISRLTYWNTRLSDQQLVTATT